MRMIRSRTALGLFGLVCLLGVAPTVHASMLVYRANLDGPSEAPPNASPGTGLSYLTIDTVTRTMRIGRVLP